MDQAADGGTAGPTRGSAQWQVVRKKCAPFVVTVFSEAGQRRKQAGRRTTRCYRLLNETDRGRLASLENFVLGAGIVSDYVERRTRAGKGMSDRNKVVKVLSGLAIEEYDGYQHAFHVIKREKLCSNILDAIIKERKRAGAIPKVGLDTLRGHAANFSKIRRQAKCLGIEVELWRATSKLLHGNGNAATINECSWMRRNRVEEFWSVYHDRSLRKDAFPQRLRPLSAVGLFSGLSEKADVDSAIPPPRLHTPTSTPKQGMYYEHKRGMRWGAVDPPDGTLMKLASDSRGFQTSSPMPTLLSPGDGLSRVPSRRDAVRSPIAALGMATLKKTSSLPALTKPLKTAFSPDSRPGSSSGFTAEVDMVPLVAARHRYLRECDLRSTLPTPLSFITGHSAKLEAVGRDLVDNELLAMVSTLQEALRVEEVNLHGNKRLTDNSLRPLLEQLLRDPLPATLRRVDLGSCVRAGSRMLEVATTFLHSVGGLRELDVSRIAISMRLQRPLCEAIGEHAVLSTVNLAETGLGGSYVARGCIASLLGSKSITSLDIGWNCFNADTFISLGRALSGNKVLRTLCLDNCSASADEAVTPISYFLEFLAYNSALTKLSIALNRIDYRAALIIEDSLDHHKKLSDLDLSQNPLGPLGMRSILRLLSRSWTGLMRFETEGCQSGTQGIGGGSAGAATSGAVGVGTNSGVSAGTATDGGSPSSKVGWGASREQGSCHVFHYMNPGGRYPLNLSRPYDRTLLRTLCKTADRFRLPLDKAFLNPSYTQAPPRLPDKLPYTHPSKDAAGIWGVPDYGLLVVTFNVQDAVESAVKGIADADFTGFLEKYMEVMRFHPDWKKVVPLFAKWKDLNGRVTEQYVFLNALAKDFNLPLSYMEQMCRSSVEFSNETLCRLSPCISGTQASRFTSLLNAHSISEYLWIHRQMTRLLDFNIQNPTGHYRLDLGHCTDYHVADQLLLLDRWEAVVDARRGRYDVSMRGDGSHLRNELFMGRPLDLLVPSVSEWSLPEFAEFEVDYVSNQRPPDNAVPLSNDLWEMVLMEIYEAACRPEDVISVLRSISHNFYLSSLQIRMMLGYFRTQEQRAEAFVTFYMRVTDLYNGKLFRVRFRDQGEMVQLMERLGYAAFFPFMQPENSQFNLDLTKSDQRLCASIYVRLAFKEKANNIREPVWIHSDGTRDALPLGVPRSWDTPSKIPPDGFFKGSYACAPEDRQFAFRRELAATYGFYNVTVGEDDVQWWTGLTEPPPDVITFLEFLISRVSHVNEAFTIIDGVDGNGVITLREFEEGFAKLKCQKFKGKDEMQRIGTLFRYMDMGGEGTISLSEWMLLDQLWKEFDLSIREFCHFLSLCFGADIEEAWQELDEDNSGSISKEEFEQAVTNMGYFGPSEAVFALIDTTDNGSIEFDEFEVLKKFMPGELDEEVDVLMP